MASAAEGSVGTLSATADGQARASYNQWLGNSIELAPDGDDLQVDSITVQARSLVPNEHFYLALTRSANQRPVTDDVVAVFDMSHPTVSGSLMTYRPETDGDSLLPTLTAGEMYWLVFGIADLDHEAASPGGLYEWDFTTGNGPFLEEEGLTVGARIATADTAGQDWESEIGTPYLFELAASPMAVPEPETAMLVIVGSLVFLFRRRRRGRQVLQVAIVGTSLALTTACKREDTLQAERQLPVPEAAIAKVGDQWLLVSDLEYLMDAQPGLTAEQALDRLIEEETMAQAAVASGLAKSPSVRAAERRLLGSRYLEQGASDPVNLGEEHAREVWAAEDERFERPARAEVAAIRRKFSGDGREEALTALEGAKKKFQELPPGQQRTGFGPVAAEFSDETNTRYRGGVIGTVSAGEKHLLLPASAVAAVVENGEPGVLDEIIVTEDSAWLLLIENYAPASKIPFEEIRGQLLQELENNARAQAKRSMIEKSKAAVAVQRTGRKLPASVAKRVNEIPGRLD